MRTLDMKRITTIGILVLASIALMSMAGCGGQAQTDSSTDTASADEVRSFSKYNFSFQCPKDFLIWQDGLLDEEANENSGLVQATPEEGNYQLFAVSWIRTWQWGLEGSLEAGFVGIENWAGIVNITKGNVVETTKTGHRMLYQEGHRMLYQYYTATTETQGEIVYGVVGAFYCPDTQRTFSLVTMQKSTTGSSAQEALAYFEGYVDAFVCH
jgi:hypothetical protein